MRRSFSAGPVAPSHKPDDSPERPGRSAPSHAVTRLLTLVEVAEEVADRRQMSVSVRHEAVLADGRRLLLLGDRGWTSSAVGFPDIWSTISVEEVEHTARTVVGPDEPFGGRSHEEMEAGHWSSLAEVLRQQAMLVEAAELQRLPHVVVFGERLLGRIGRA
jgi:hypothetical protein